jgi:hypothetical protein
MVVVEQPAVGCRPPGCVDALWATATYVRRVAASMSRWASSLGGPTGSLFWPLTGPRFGSFWTFWSLPSWRYGARESSYAPSQGRGPGKAARASLYLHRQSEAAEPGPHHVRHGRVPTRVLGSGSSLSGEPWPFRDGQVAFIFDIGSRQSSGPRARTTRSTLGAPPQPPLPSRGPMLSAEALFDRGQSLRIDVSDQAGTCWNTSETGFRGEEEFGTKFLPS